MKNWITVGSLLVVMLIASGFLPPVVYLFGAVVFFIIGITEYKNQGVSVPAGVPVRSPNQPRVQSAATAQVVLPERKMPANIPSDLKCPSCGATIKPTDKQCKYCGSSLQPLLDLPEPAKLAGLGIDQAVRVVHPQKGAQDYRVLGRLLYTELWQASQGPTVPWTPTGNYYAGFALWPEAYLLNWQDRFYLLDGRRSITDLDINRDFMPYARTFAQSNQTATVRFAYAGANWQMVDIGRFAIEFADGTGLHLRRGAIGRFIHASDKNRALVVEDFQSGGEGGQDTLWQGFQIQETDIKF
jgi:hypothetical protein